MNNNSGIFLWISIVLWVRTLHLEVSSLEKWSREFVKRRNKAQHADNTIESRRIARTSPDHRESFKCKIIIFIAQTTSYVDTGHNPFRLRSLPPRLRLFSRDKLFSTRRRLAQSLRIHLSNLSVHLLSGNRLFLTVLTVLPLPTSALLRL